MAASNTSFKTRFARVCLVAALGALGLLSAVTATAAAAPRTATDWFVGTAITPAGQMSPVQIDPHDLTIRSDGAIGLGYTYRASGEASGQLPGPFTYEERGYLYFTNPSDPTTMVGSRFSSGVFSLVPARLGSTLQIADTAPDSYTAGVQTIMGKLPGRVGQDLSLPAGRPGPLTYGYFTFTNAQGTFTGYATPDFRQFAIQITFDLPPR
jgi:hypothetical protein